VARKDSAILLLGPNVLSVSVDSNLRSFLSEVENHVEECDMRAYAFGLATACFDGMDQKSSWPGLSRPSTPGLPSERRGCAGQAQRQARAWTGYKRGAPVGPAVPIHRFKPAL